MNNDRRKGFYNDPSHPTCRTHSHTLKHTHARAQEALVEVVPNIKFLQWINSYDGTFKGCCFAEMATPDAAAHAVGLGAAKRKCCGRPVFVNFAPNDGKSIWPPKDKVDIMGVFDVAEGEAMADCTEAVE